MELASGHAESGCWSIEAWGLQKGDSGCSWQMSTYNRNPSK